MLTIVIAIVVVLLSIHLYRLFKDRKLSGIPGPPPYPFFGNIFDLGMNSIDIRTNIERLARQYGRIYKMWIGPTKAFIMLSDPKIIEGILSSNVHIHKGLDYRFLHDWLGDGLLTSAGLKWKQRRKILTPAFHFAILEKFVDVFNRDADILVTKLRKEVGGDSFDVYPYVTLCALDSICETAMGTSIHAQEQSDAEYVNAVRDFCTIMHHRSFSAWMQFDLLFKCSLPGWRQRNAIKILHNLTNSVIKERRELILAEKGTSEDAENFGIKKRCALLDVLLQSTINGKPLSNEDIREEVDTFMFEGHDTVSSGISFALYSLSRHPEIQQRAYQEIIDVLGEDKTRKPTQQELQEMRYLDRVLKEVLRMYPSVPIIAREIYEDLTLEGVLIPAGVSVNLLFFTMHMDPELFPQPEVFNPERFTEDRDGQNVYSYLPFSAGPRNCIGQKFAMLEMKAIISKVLREYEILPAGPDVQIEAAITLKSVNGINMKLKNRE